MGGVEGSWARVGIVSVFGGSWAGDNGPTYAGGSMTELWFGDNVVISLAIVGCDPSSARSRAGGDLPSDEISLVHMCFF